MQGYFGNITEKWQSNFKNGNPLSEIASFHLTDITLQTIDMHKINTLLCTINAHSPQSPIKWVSIDGQFQFFKTQLLVG